MKTILGVITFISLCAAIFGIGKIVADSKKTKSKARR